MKWIMFAFMTGSSATGPTTPMFMTAEFDDKPACEAAARELARVSRAYRIIGSSVDGVCVPKASQPKSE